MKNQDFFAETYACTANYLAMMMTSHLNVRVFSRAASGFGLVPLHAGVLLGTMQAGSSLDCVELHG